MNLDLLMNIKPAIEEGVSNWFQAQAISAFTRLNAPQDFKLPRPRVEIVARVSDATGHKHVIAGVYYSDTWHFDLAIRCIFNPANQSGANQGLEQLVARTRGMMQTFAQATWVDTVNFPYHLIVEPLHDTTTDDTLQADDNEEWTVLTFSGIVQIRTDAWINT